MVTKAARVAKVPNTILVIKSAASEPNPAARVGMTGSIDARDVLETIKCDVFMVLMPVAMLG